MTTPQSPSSFSQDQLEALRALERRINAILPPQYQGCFEVVSPRSMGSAQLKTGADGLIAWDEIWTTFCHLALAGGPPHRGSLLEPPREDEVAANPNEQQQVIAEIERAVRLTTSLSPVASPTPGWIGVCCDDANEATWLMRAIVAENVSARRQGALLFLPAGPRFRIEKEIKNVVTCLAKTCHYLVDHLPPECRPVALDRDLVEPASRAEIAAAPSEYELAANELASGIRQVTSLDTSTNLSPGWIDIACASEEMAVWLLRAVAVADILVRREAERLCVPVSLLPTPRDGTHRVLTAVAEAHRLWLVHQAVGSSRG
jgi:hypothetical protein